MTQPASRRWKEVFPRPPQVYVLALGAMVFPIFALFAPTQISATLLILGTLALILNPVTGFWPLKTQPYLLPLGLLLVLGFLSALWATEAAEAAQRAGRLLAFLAAGTLLLTHARELSRPDRQVIGWALVNGFAVLAVLFVEERMFDKWLLRETRGIDDLEAHAILNQPGVLLALLSWPVAGFLWSVERRAAAVMVFLLTPLTMIGEEGKAGLLALAVGWVAAVAAMIMPVVTRNVACILVVLLTVGLPFAASSSTLFETTYRALGFDAYGEKHRLVIWHFTGSRIAERPVLGWGLDSAKSIPDGDQRVVDYVDQTELTKMGKKTRESMREAVVMPLHPHNAVLQVQLELGMAGLVALAAFLVLTIRAIPTNGPWMIRGCRMGLFAGALSVACVSFGVWQSWWVSSLFLLATFGAALPIEPSRQRRERDVPENSVVNPPQDETEREIDPRGNSA